MTRTMIQRLQTARAVIYGMIYRRERVNCQAIAQAMAAKPGESEQFLPHLQAFALQCKAGGPLPAIPPADPAPEPLTMDYILESLGMMRKRGA
jgi:hypothetical protein